MSAAKLIVWNILSIVVSVLFVFHGASLLVLGDTPAILILAGIVNVAYGAFSLILLALSWVKPRGVYARIILTSIFVLMVFQVVGSIDLGIISGLEFAGLLIVFVMLTCNWLSVKYVVQFKSLA